MANQADILKFSKTISPSKIPAFLRDTQALHDEIAAMALITPLRDQAMGAAKIMGKFGLI